jgi:hypothetical protein
MRAGTAEVSKPRYTDYGDSAIDTQQVARDFDRTNLKKRFLSGLVWAVDYVLDA